MKILVDSYKNLVITDRTITYQHESLVDTWVFFISEKYNDVNMRNFTFMLNYLNTQGVRKTELLTEDQDIVKDGYIAYRLPVTSEISKYVGTITMSISGTWLDASNKKQYSFKTGTLQIDISPLSELYDYVPDDSLNVIDQKMLQLDAKIQAVEKMGDNINKSIPNDLTMNSDNILKLSIDGEAIGNGVEILNNVYDVDGNTSDGIIDLDDISGDVDPYEPTETIPIIDL